ncbi:hypothetical protein SDJN02_24568 [Cucurbita argyrosperma subsp. argyrosperma]|nr:hypothetical protein SDJN02_24568 [Cucurbita argyrosperma subsp. argyrosperma]
MKRQRRIFVNGDYSFHSLSRISITQLYVYIIGVESLNLKKAPLLINLLVMKLLIFLMADAITPVGQIEVLSGNYNCSHFTYL